jgi:hypothetical protein
MRVGIMSKAMSTCEPRFATRQRETWIDGTTGTFSGEFAQRGLYNKFWAPGHGVIVREAGQISGSVVDAFNLETGPQTSVWGPLRASS